MGIKQLNLFGMKLKIYVEFLPASLQILGGGLIIFGIGGLYAGELPILNIALIIMGLILLTTHQGATVDTEKKEIADYYWLLGLKLQHFKQKYEEIDTVLLAPANYSQSYGFVPRYHAQGQLYQGFLKMPGQDSLFLGSSKSRDRLYQKLTTIANRLKVPLTDVTVR